MVIRTRAALLREPGSASASVGRPLRPAPRRPTPPEKIRLRGDRVAELADRLIRVACGSGLLVHPGARAPPPVDPPPFARGPFHLCPHPPLAKRSSRRRLSV